MTEKSEKVTFDFGNSTILFKLLIHVTEDEFSLLHDYIRMREFNKFREYVDVLKVKYELVLKGTYINPCIVRSKITSKLIPIDLPFLRKVALAER